MKFSRGLAAFAFALLTQLSAAQALSERDRGNMALWTEQSDGITTVLIGKRNDVVPMASEVVARCPMPTKVIHLDTNSIKAEGEASGIFKAAAEFNQEQGIQVLTGGAPVTSEMLDKFGTNCLLYWSGLLDKAAYLRVQAMLGRAWAAAVGEADAPKVYLIDSPTKTYATGVTTHGETNTDEIAAIVRSVIIPVSILSANASATWSRNDDVVAAAPAVTVIHFSAFESDKLNACSPTANLENNCMYLLINLVGEVLRKTDTKVILYSRIQGICDASNGNNLVKLIALMLDGDASKMAERVAIVPMAGDKLKTGPSRWQRVSRLVADLVDGANATEAAEKAGGCALH